MAQEISPSRRQDERNRANMLEAVKICLRHGLLDEAKDLLTSAGIMGERIKTKSYQQEDETLKKLWAMIKGTNTQA